MSTMPWGTMNGWLRLEAEQRHAWTRQRVQDLRAAQVAGPPAPAPVRAVPDPAPRRAATTADPGRAEAA